MINYKVLLQLLSLTFHRYPILMPWVLNFNCSKHYDRQSKLALLFDHNKKNGSTFFDFLVEAVPLCYSTFIKILLSELSNTNYLFV